MMIGVAVAAISTRAGGHISKWPVSTGGTEPPGEALERMLTELRGRASMAIKFIQSSLAAKVTHARTMPTCAAWRWRWPI
jgi:hypothetical protein